MALRILGVAPKVDEEGVAPKVGEKAASGKNLGEKGSTRFSSVDVIAAF